jgi:hypothetical protein
MTNAQQSLVDEVESAIDTGSAENRLETIKRVTDLFLSSAGSFNTEQVEVFDIVLERLVKTIEIRAIADVSARIALAEISAQLAPVSQAPPAATASKTSRSLNFWPLPLSSSLCQSVFETG